MSVLIKVARLLGAVLVMLALVPWLGISPAAATGAGSDKGSSAAQGQDNNKGDKAAKEDKAANSAKSDDKAAAKVESKADGKADGNADKKPDGKAADKKSDGKAAHKGAANNSSSSNHKVTLCHRTNSDHNPYVRITVSVNSVVKTRGHDGHTGPIFAAGLKAAHQKWGDIIPSFTYTTKTGSTASYGGKNWPAGRAIFDAGCTVSQPTTTQFGTTSVSPTVSPTGTQTVTTTVTGPNGTVTVTQTVTPDTSVLPTKIGDDDTDVLGGSTGVLPHTGLDLPLGAALGLSFLLLLAGGALMVVPSRVNTERNRRH